MNGWVKGLLVALCAVAVTALVLALAGVPVASGLQSILRSAAEGPDGWSRTLTRTTPLLLCSLGILLAWRAGLYNIGAEGQYVVGGIGAAWMAKLAVMLAPAMAAPLFLAAGFVFGAVLAAFAGWLWVKRGVQVVISTILLNFLALEALAWVVRGPLQESKNRVPMSEQLPPEFTLTAIGDSLHSGVVVAVLAVPAVWILLYHTQFGLWLRTVGANPTAARANAVPVGRVQVTTMALSGGLCGMAGAIDYAGVTGRLADGFSQNWGFLAIPVALLGGLHPLGSAGAALLFGALFAGSEGLRTTSPIGNEIVPLVQGAAVLAFLAVNRWLGKPARQQEAAA